MTETMEQKVHPETGNVITPVDPRTSLPIAPGAVPPTTETIEVDPSGQKFLIIRDTKTGQTISRSPIVDTGANRQHPRLQFLQQAENYLLESGWEMTGVNESGLSMWKDPISKSGAKPESKVMLHLPLKGGGQEPIKQLVVPPLAMDWPMQDAMQIQWQRDEASPAKLDDVIARKEAELQALYKRRAERDRENKPPETAGTA